MERFILCLHSVITFFCSGLNCSHVAIHTTLDKYGDLVISDDQWKYRYNRKHYTAMKDLLQCTFYNQRQNQSGTARPLNNLFQGAREAWATCVQRDHPADSRTSWGIGKNNNVVNVTPYLTFWIKSSETWQNVNWNVNNGKHYTSMERRENMRNYEMGERRRTGCIDWAPACCSVTSDSDGKLLGQVVPWCCPYWSHQHIDCPGRRAPFLTCWEKKIFIEQEVWAASPETARHFGCYKHKTLSEGKMC